MIYVAASIPVVNVLAVLVIARLGHQPSGASHAKVDASCASGLIAAPSSFHLAITPRAVRRSAAAGRLPGRSPVIARRAGPLWAGARTIC